MDDHEPTMREIGQKGGNTTKERYGTEFYAQIGRKGGAAATSKAPANWYVNIGRKGGEAGKGVKKPRRKARVEVQHE